MSDPYTKTLQLYLPFIGLNAAAIQFFTVRTRLVNGIVSQPVDKQSFQGKDVRFKEKIEETIFFSLLTFFSFFFFVSYLNYYFLLQTNQIKLKRSVKQQPKFSLIYKEISQKILHHLVFQRQELQQQLQIHQKMLFLQ